MTVDPVFEKVRKAASVKMQRNFSVKHSKTENQTLLLTRIQGTFAAMMASRDHSGDNLIHKT